jgi:hypothetical protein
METGKQELATSVNHLTMVGNLAQLPRLMDINGGSHIKSPASIKGLTEVSKVGLH